MNLKNGTKEKIYFVVGPTASGKTKLAIELAKKINGEIISADSRQVYLDLDLSTGKVTEKEMEGVPHHMLDIVKPGESFNVVDFTKLALEKIEEIQKRGKNVIICGGTGFYIDNLLFDYSLPEVTKNSELRNSLISKNEEELLEILKNLDAKFAKSIDFKNKNRVIRAIEIATTLGKVPELNKKIRFKNNKIIFTEVPREKVRENILVRLNERISAGMIQEIETVKQRYNLSDKYLESLGLEFRYVNKFLNKELTMDEMKERLYIEICKYARRQDAWFRRYRRQKEAKLW